jgi:hypothetical protein
VAEHLLGRHNALSSNPSTAKIKQNKFFGRQKWKHNYGNSSGARKKWLNLIYMLEVVLVVFANGLVSGKHGEKEETHGSKN